MARGSGTLEKTDSTLKRLKGWQQGSWHSFLSETGHPHSQHLHLEGLSHLGITDLTLSTLVLTRGGSLYDPIHPLWVLTSL